VPRPKLILLVGLPGSGKSTWATREKLPVLSSDELRRTLADDPTDQSIHARVFSVLRLLIKHRLELKRPITCIDATNLTPKERRPYIALARRHGASVEAIFFDTPIPECQRRNRLRKRVVPREAIETMARKLVVPSTREGFSKVTTLRKP
jgi:predicted kinase